MDLGQQGWLGVLGLEFLEFGAGFKVGFGCVRQKCGEDGRV